MGVLVAPVDANLNVSNWQTPPHDLSWDVPSKWLNAYKQSGLRVVRKKFAQSRSGNIGSSHDALLKLIGQRPACVASAVRASLF